MPKYYLNQMFMEARFNNALFFNDLNKLQLIINDLSSIFPRSQYDSNSKTLSLISVDNLVNTTINEGRFLINFNEPRDFDTFKNIAIQTANSIDKHLSINNYNRLGIRCMRGIEKTNIKECMQYVKKNFMKVDSKILSDTNIDITNCGAFYGLKINDYDVNLNIRPHLFQVMEIENNILKRQVSKPQVLIDTDIFKANVRNVNENNLELVTDIINININNINEFIKKMSIY